MIIARYPSVTGRYPELVNDENPNGNLIEQKWGIFLCEPGVGTRIYDTSFDTKDEAERFALTLDPDPRIDDTNWKYLED